MKKKKLVLSSRLDLGKNIISSLDNAQSAQVAGGGDTIFQCPPSNGCSNQDTRCLVDKPTFAPGAGDCVYPPATLYPCNPDVVGTVQGPTRP